MSTDVRWPRSVDLSGDRVVLRPLAREDGPALVAAASDGDLWRSTVTTVPDGSSVESYLAYALAGQAAGTVLPFATTLRADGILVGSTRFWHMDSRNRGVEIGHTWIAASWQRTFVNTEAKYLMLRFAFEVLGCIRVQFQTDVLNEPSQAAILRLGATPEGVARHERIMPDGRKRDTMRFSIIDDEWPGVRRRLEARLDGHTSFTVGPGSRAEAP
jgi:RimJ/RimL family protein N-acetyltransferase